MEIQKLVLGFKDRETEFSFENKVFVIQDKVLLENLSKPNIKNQNSSMIIKSLNDAHVSDVIQIKINVAETGHFLVSFAKESLDEEKRTELLKQIGNLKSDEAPSIDIQFKKIQDLLEILNNFGPIYATFVNNGDIKIETPKLEELQLGFPLLILEQSKKKFDIKIGKPKKEKQPTVEKEPKQKKTHQYKEKNYEPFSLFDVDYIFALIFALLGSFAITASVFELMNKEGIAAFLIILGVVFTITLVIAVYSTVYKKCQVRNPWLRYYLAIYIIIGIAGGILTSYFICKGVLKTEIEDFNYKKMMLISILISVVALLSSIESCRLANIFMKMRQNKKSQ